MLKKFLIALLFIVLASPQAFTTVRSLLGGWVASTAGLPKVGGLAAHALVFVLLSALIWRGTEKYERKCVWHVEKKYWDCYNI